MPVKYFDETIEFYQIVKDRLSDVPMKMLRSVEYSVM